MAASDGQELILDHRHALVWVAAELAGDLRQSDAGAVPLLLFRSASIGATPRAGLGRVPELWFELGGRTIEFQLREAAGFPESDGSAVALFEGMAEIEASERGDYAATARCGLRTDSGEVLVAVPADWMEHLQTGVPERG